MPRTRRFRAGRRIEAINRQSAWDPRLSLPVPMSVMAILGLGPDPLIAGFLVAAVFLAGALRGYSGFGFALAAVPLLTTCWPPVLAIPVVLILEMVLTVAFLPGLWVSFDRRSVPLLVVAAAIATPIGQWLLSHLNPAI